MLRLINYIGSYYTPHHKANGSILVMKDKRWYPNNSSCVIFHSGHVIPQVTKGGRSKELKIERI